MHKCCDGYHDGKSKYRQAQVVHVNAASRIMSEIAPFFWNYAKVEYCYIAEAGTIAGDEFLEYMLTTSNISENGRNRRADSVTIITRQPPFRSASSVGMGSPLISVET